MSAKITIRDTDGTCYQLKKRVADMVLEAGYSRRITRGLHEMLSVRLVKALDLSKGQGYPVYAYGVPYIPAKLPPKELPGVFFEAPDGAINTAHKLILDLAHLGLAGIAEYA